MSRKWTDKEERILLDLYGVKTYKEIAQMLNRTENAVERRTRILREKNGIPVKNSHKQRELEFKSRFESLFPNFKYHSGYNNVDTPFKSECRICGHIQERNAQCIRRESAIHYCSGCIQINNLRKDLIKVLDKHYKTKLKELENIEKTKETEKKKIKELTSICQECGEVFIGTSKGMKYCSLECSNKRNNRLKEIKRRKKIKKNGRVDWDISLSKLVERDKNICYICGEECDESDYVKDNENNFIVGKNYPSVDHVKPISKGGTHIWSNIRLAHHYCNSIKRDNILKRIG